MLNFLFYDNERGDNFFVQLENWCTVEDAWEVVREEVYGDDWEDVEYIDCYTDEQAERMGYDTY